MTRIFVGNLPTDIVEKEVENEFAAYGTVNKVEVKHKRDALSNDIMSTFAFVTITITDSLLNQCLEEFKNEQFRGRFLTVSVARESFMEKLKREREESTQRSPDTDLLPVNPKPIVIKNPFRPNVQNKTERTFNSNNVESSNSVPPIIDPTYCVKRKSQLFTENGKIKIPSFNESVNSVVPTKVERKTFDEKSEMADRKRVESLINMKNTYDQQKKAVQQALASAGPTANKRITFDEPSNDVGVKSVKKSQPLFEEDGDDDDDDVDYAKSFENKNQYEGKRGARLQKLQSRFQSDQRFKMNENFLDDNDGDVIVDETERVDEVADSDERKWQYDMLESVIGKKLQSVTKKKSDNLMLRYDPTKNDHEKYEKTAMRKGSHHSASSMPAMKQQKLDDDGAFQVSKEQFFTVTNQLTSALKPASEGFSLLSMFGRDNIVDPKPMSTYQEITLSKGQQNVLLNNNFMFYDESSDEETVAINKIESNSANEPKPKSTKKNAKAEIWHEPFFIFGSDVRLQDGLSFFLPNSSDTNVAEDFENKQKEMRSIIKRKIKKSIKRVLPRGAKPNKKFGRLVRDVA